MNKTETITAVKERPILFSTPMVKAIMEGRKTVTRRVISIQPDDSCYFEMKLHIHEIANDTAILTIDYNQGNRNPSVKCPYGKPGDILWVRETWSMIHYEGVDEKPTYLYRADDDMAGIKRIWKPSIFMPREACRLCLEIKSIGVERLHEITEEDAIREGLSILSKDGGRTYKYGIPDNDGLPGNDDNGWPWTDWNTFATEAFFTLWRKINGEESFQANPWVWRIDFKKL